MKQQSALKIEASDNSPEAIAAAAHYQETYDGLHHELSKNNAANGIFMNKETTYECALKAFELTQMLSTISKTPEHRTQLRREISKVIANVQLHADHNGIPSGWMPGYSKRTYRALQKVQKQHMRNNNKLGSAWDRSSSLKKAIIATAISALFYSATLNDNNQNTTQKHARPTPQAAPHHP